MPQPTHSKPQFREILQELKTEQPSLQTKQEALPKISIAASQMPLGEFLRLLSQQAEVSIIWEERLDSRPVSLEVQDRTVEEVLTMVARRMQMSLAGGDGLYFVGTLNDEDRAVLIKRVGRFTQEDLKRALSVLSTDIGRVETYPDGTVIFADRVEVLEKANELLDQLNALDANVWLVQLYIADSRRRSHRETGMDTTLELDITTALTKSASSLEYAAKARSILKATIEEGTNQILAQPLFLLLDGTPATLSSVEKVPIPKRSISSEGTVATFDYAIIEAGTKITVTVRDNGQNSAQLEYTIELGEITGYVQEAPITTVQEITGTTAIRSGGTYLLGALDRTTKSSQQTGPGIALLRNQNEGQSIVEVWGIVQRIGNETAPVIAAPGKHPFEERSIEENEAVMEDLSYGRSDL